MRARREESEEEMKRQHERPVTISGAFKYLNGSVRIMNRTIEGKGKNLTDCIVEALQARKDKDFSFIIMEAPIAVQKGAKGVLHVYRVDLRGGEYILTHVKRSSKLAPRRAG